MATKDTELQALTYEQCVIGCLVNSDGPWAFKLAAIVGFTRAGKIRVCKWSHNSRGWSKPQAVWPRELYLVERKKLSSRHRSVYNHALDSFLTLGGAEALNS